jgi:hypothetical protein
MVALQHKFLTLQELSIFLCGGHHGLLIVKALFSPCTNSMASVLVLQLQCPITNHSCSPAILPCASHKRSSADAERALTQHNVVTGGVFLPVQSRPCVAIRTRQPVSISNNLPSYTAGTMCTPKALSSSPPPLMLTLQTPRCTPP